MKLHTDGCSTKCTKECRTLRGSLNERDNIDYSAHSAFGEAAEHHQDANRFKLWGCKPTSIITKIDQALQSPLL
jgi:hypothetical protein